ncbi:YihY/virulence factor BrkB family protein [Clostridium fermenticellae]|uniref:YihY/virulence factor BrkB family protein n=1 Tax=Clostridium fermenticellae TaxID=2068654 RepID=A0A386H3J4_9CLOT|nr:YihY/virulence factor BrkB family protein [Clostridium fermenticellae]AYD40250.1 YihY/virulence factor BrkB family protein [Clostridium fermenticellae]
MRKNSLYYLKCIVIRFIKDDVLALSSQLAFSLVFAFFPFLIFILGLMGYMPIQSDSILKALNFVFPSDILKLINNTVIYIVDNKNRRVLFPSLIFTIWTTCSGFQAVIRGLNMAYGLREKRSKFKLYIISILCTLGFIMIILITSMLLICGQIIGRYLTYTFQLPGEFNIIWNIIRYVVMIISISFIFAILYKYMPSIKLNWNEVIAGAFTATVSLIIVSICFAFYVNNFSNYSFIYGSIGAVIALLTWLFILSNIIIIGGEVNAIVYRKR